MKATDSSVTKKATHKLTQLVREDPVLSHDELLPDDRSQSSNKRVN